MLLYHEKYTPGLMHIISYW